MEFFDITSPEVLVSLLTLTILEIVLGIDNVIFISLIARNLPEEQQDSARKVGLLAALGTRILLLFSITWVVGLEAPITEIFGQTLSWRDVILLGGGVFLMYKGTQEIHDTVEGEAHGPKAVAKGFAGIIMQIMVLDVIFSLDSVITAVGMVDDISIMITAVAIAIGVMMWASGPLSEFIQRHPTVKMLALSFLLLVGMVLIADGLHFHIPRGYIYFAIAFSVLVEVLNLAAAKRRALRLKKQQADKGK